MQGVDLGMGAHRSRPGADNSKVLVLKYTLHYIKRSPRGIIIIL